MFKTLINSIIDTLETFFNYKFERKNGYVDFNFVFTLHLKEKIVLYDAALNYSNIDYIHTCVYVDI